MSTKLDKNYENKSALTTEQAADRLRQAFLDNIETLAEAARMELFISSMLNSSLSDLRVELFKGSNIEMKPNGFLNVLLTLMAMIGIAFGSAVMLISLLAMKFWLITAISIAATWLSYQFFFPIGKRLSVKLGDALRSEKDAILSISHLLCNDAASRASLTLSSETIDRAKGTALMLHAGNPVSNKDIISLGEVLILAAPYQNMESFEKTFCQKQCCD